MAGTAPDDDNDEPGVPRPVGENRTPDERERDRAAVARRYCQGQTQAEIAAALGCSRSQVGYDLEVVRRRWRESSLRDFDAARSEELAKLDRAEAAAWEGWERSRRDAVKRTVTDDPEGQTTKRERARQAGAPQFLQVVLGCIERRCRLLGLDAQPDATVNPPAPVTVVVETRADVERLPRVEELLRAALPSPN